VELARTFLTIIETGSFVRAARRLGVTQSTISMRVKELEQRLGQPLFVRNKAGARLPAAGTRFSRHATLLLRTWTQARQEIGLPPEFRAVVNISGQFSLWDRLLIRWIAWMRRECPEIALRTEVAVPEETIRQLIEGAVDIGVMYSPLNRAGLQVSPLFEDVLVMVSTNPQESSPPGKNYIYVDWGPEFRTHHHESFPDLETPGLFVGLGVLALQYLLESGGTGYFPIRAVAEELQNGRLFMVQGAPEFRRPSYVVTRAGEQSEAQQTALDSLVRVVREESEATARMCSAWRAGAARRAAGGDGLTPPPGAGA
jgi:DNA-binding transcriptional LysR family regulator